jgi:hypothetical protein
MEGQINGQGMEKRSLTAGQKDSHHNEEDDDLQK